MVHEEARVAETRISELAMAGAEAKAVDLSAVSRMDCARVSSMAEWRAGGEMVRGPGRVAVCRALLATIQETGENSGDWAAVLVRMLLKARWAGDAPRATAPDPVSPVADDPIFVVAAVTDHGATAVSPAEACRAGSSKGRVVRAAHRADWAEARRAAAGPCLAVCSSAATAAAGLRREALTAARRAVSARADLRPAGCAASPEAIARAAEVRFEEERSAGRVHESSPAPAGCRALRAAVRPGACAAAGWAVGRAAVGCAAAARAAVARAAVECGAAGRAAAAAGAAGSTNPL